MADPGQEDCKVMKADDIAALVAPFSPAGDDILSALNQGLAGRLADILGQRIVSGEVEAGAPLPIESGIQSEFGVSRTVVREATRLLAAKGLTITRPKTGTRVRPRADWNMVDSDVLRWHIGPHPDRAFISALFEVRELVEPHAAMMAAERANAKQITIMEQAVSEMAEYPFGSNPQLQADLTFHLTIMDASGNTILRSVGKAICSALLGSFRLTWRHVKDDHAIGMHKAVFNAIKDRDAELALILMRRLVRVSREEALDALIADRVRELDDEKGAQAKFGI